MDERATNRSDQIRVSGAPDSWPLSAREAALALGVSERTIRRAIARGMLPATKHAGVYRVTPRDLAHFGSLRRGSSSPATRPRREPPRLLPLPERRAGAAADPAQPLTSLIGREAERAAVCALLLRSDVRLVTLTGPGGVGKTRLALRVLTDLRGQGAFPDGAWFVELAPVGAPELVAATIAYTLGVWEAGERSPLDALRVHLWDKDALIVLDNAEHLLPAAPDVVALLAACPRLTVLVTSRALLRVTGERDFPVPPLSLPDPDRSPAPEEVGAAEAVRLFVERTQAIQPDFALTEANAPAVAAICRRLDGVPLLIELAAARSKVLSPPALLARLDRRLPLLTGGPRDAPARLRTMRDAIAWSHDLLSPAEQALFRRLAVFAGGFTLEAAEAVGRAGSCLAGDVLADLSALVDGSLLHREADADGELRFGMLETVREFGLAQLPTSGEEAEIRAAHAAHFLALAERIAPLLIGPRRRAEVAGMEREHANLRGALSWFAANEEGEVLLRLAVAVSHFWEVTGHWTEGAAWLERALDAESRPSPARVEALASLGLIRGYRGDAARAELLVRAALDLSRRLGATEQTSSVLAVLASLLVDRGRYAEAEPLLAEAVALARQAGNADLEAVALTQAGRAAWGRGDPIEATARLERAQAIWRELGHRFTFSVAAGPLANVAVEAGDFARAAEQNRQFLADAPDSVFLLARFFPNVASLGAALGEPARAARLFGAGAALAETVGLAPAWPERGLHERALAASRVALGGDAFDAAFKEGMRLPRERIEAEVAAVLDASSRAPARRPPSDAARDRHDLTPREREVLRLVALRLTDREIADRLFVTRRTASKHVAAILAKLGVPDRRAAAAEATRRGLA